MHRLLPAALLLLCACGGPAAAPGSSFVELVQRLNAREYRAWTGDPEIRGAVKGSPHGRVRVFFDDALVASLKAGSAVHPVGATVVKEVYGDSDQVGIHSLMVKTGEGAGKESWTYFEGGGAPEYKGALYGVGHSICVGCHQAGADYVLSPLP